jgi:hypothetical protein
MLFKLLTVIRDNGDQFRFLHFSQWSVVAFEREIQESVWIRYLTHIEQAKVGMRHDAAIPENDWQVCL